MKAFKQIVKILFGIILAGGVAVGVLYWIKLPAIHVARGIACLVNETGEYGNPILEEAGWEKMIDRITGGAVRIELEGSFLTQEQKEALGMQVMVLLDQVERKMSITADTRLLGFDLGSMVLSGDEDTVYLELPGITDKVFWMGTKDFGARYQDSMWARWLKLNIDEDYELKFVPEWKSTQVEEFLKLCRAQIQTGRDMLSRNTFLMALLLNVKKAEAEPDCYVLTLPAELVNTHLDMVQKGIQSGKYGENVKTFWEELMSEMGGPNGNYHLSEDLKLLIRLDENDRIVGLRTAEALSFTETSLGITLELNLLGDEKTMDRLNGSVRFQNGQAERCYSFTREATPAGDGRRERWTLQTPKAEYTLDSSWYFSSKKFEIAVDKESKEGEAPYHVSMKGSLKAARGDSLVLNVDSLVFPFLGDKNLEMSGSLTMEPLAEKIVLPEGEIDFFGMSELDILAILLSRL